MQSVYMVPLSEFPIEIADFLERCSFFACQNDDSDQDYLEFDLNADLTDCSPVEEEAYYEVRRFLLSGLMKGTKRPEFILIAQNR